MFTGSIKEVEKRKKEDILILMALDGYRLHIVFVVPFLVPGGHVALDSVECVYGYLVNYRIVLE